MINDFIIRTTACSDAVHVTCTDTDPCVNCSKKNMTTCTAWRSCACGFDISDSVSVASQLAP